MHALMTDLYPLCRSITGEGLRQTLRRLQRLVPLEIHEVPTGTKILDWVVPREWNVRDAYVKNSRGERVIDFCCSNLHLVQYSVPVHARMRLDELRRHLHTLPEHPDWIPYRTAYYSDTWGFCLTHRQYLTLADEEYEVRVDATLTEGSLTYGEVYIPGELADEILISAHVCHPSLCNDNLSGVALATFLARERAERPRRYSYRWVFAPVTVGAIAWLAAHEEQVGTIRHGLIAACVGDQGSMTYKRSRRGTAEIDRAVAHVLRHRGKPHEIVDFFPYGYDERQYCSPGFDLPVGCLMRTPHGQYQEYHSSADNLSFVSVEALADSFETYIAVLNLLEQNRAYRNRLPKGEPQLGRRGLYDTGSGDQARRRQMAMLWVLNQSDGGRTLLDIAERADLDFATIRTAAERLIAHGLLEPCEATPP